MEGEAVAQVATPLFMHQALPGRFCEPSAMTKKREASWVNPSWHNHHQQNQQQYNSKATWNPKVWDWDSVMFVAKPKEISVDLQSGAEGSRLGGESEQRLKGDETLKQQKLNSEETLKPIAFKRNDMEDAENLTLKLGGSNYSAVEDTSARPSKRVRSGSPGSSSYPMCQVDDCRADLSGAKDYHRRHKVCEVHSKTTKALVGKQMQRFCQQCSRFHPLQEFDEGKRSCRRRLAGHNRRRRKTQPDDVSSRLLLSANQDNGSPANLDIVNLLNVIARLQGVNADKTINGQPLPDKDRLIQILSKINSTPASESSGASLAVPEGFDLNVSQTLHSMEHPLKPNGNQSPPSTTDLFAVLSAALGTSSSDGLAVLSRGLNNHSTDYKVQQQPHLATKLNAQEQAVRSDIQKTPGFPFPSSGLERSNILPSQGKGYDNNVEVSRQGLSLQLFSSSPEDDSPSKLGSTRKYFSSDSSNPMEDRSPSSSPPIVRKLFPLHSAAENMKQERISICREENMVLDASPSHGSSSALELFKSPNGKAENGSHSNLPYQGMEARSAVFQAGYSSSSGSDQSPSSSNSDSQERTERIIFKLFDKNPSNFPGKLGTKILEWLSHSPSEMESYIRPGCVVLSVYISMSATAWEELQEGLMQRIRLLVEDSTTDFWRSGRFLVQTDRQLASHKDGKIRLCKSWRTWSTPQLVLVSPLAVEGGRDTQLVLRGHNLTLPDTKIHCAHMGKYITKDVLKDSSVAVYDELDSETFNFPGDGVPNVMGRFFIEVENGFKGNSFPVIIAEASVCTELRTLEPDFEEDLRTVNGDDSTCDIGCPRSREDALHFLNELGWLFQRKNTPSRFIDIRFSSTRFKFLFVFSVERDWLALVKTLLDIFVDENLGTDGNLTRESSELLSEIHLLNRAVKRKCRKMVDLLLCYSLCRGGPKKLLFTPNLAGPGGLTPLHLAACTQNSEDLVDALTSDPLEVGLKFWNTVTDANGQTPYAYALMRNNNHYNRLVGRKLAERNGHVSLTVMESVAPLEPSSILSKSTSLQPRSCANCVAMEASGRRYRMPRSHGLLHRPYVHSMLAIAAVCVCVCLFLRCPPDIGSVAPFKWETIDFGSL
ncbi:hypothetical protein AMTRI_Chr03g138150 [Amborella trichopoda]|uniref:SBP-type domain-containing protein n=1 Tax=Amborella trichopoda TaxID=13333 RepID=W1PUW0_AMBTC|nr:squamosa promoter-binding-like protein 14 [Amborella trichopoda]ERN11496.1 hypothetical protein AMTR_s00022p00106940 [Amborella trichopoda]|eukprot:XP_006849915.1 squamosa promoter-binding-like protein 14 [Amborella trichopoda]